MIIVTFEKKINFRTAISELFRKTLSKLPYTFTVYAGSSVVAHSTYISAYGLS